MAAIGRNEVALICLAAVYALFAYQQFGLLRRGRWGQFLVRLALAPVILLFDWPIPRRRWRDGENGT